MKLEYGGLLKINEQKDVEYDGLLKINEQKDVEIAKLRKNLSVSNSKLSEYVELKTYIPYPEVWYVLTVKHRVSNITIIFVDIFCENEFMRNITLKTKPEM